MSSQLRLYTRSEADEQAAVIDYCLHRGHPYDTVIVSMAGNIVFHNNWALIRKLEMVGAIGTKSRPQLKGRPDMMWPVPRRGYHGLAIELKKDRQARITPEEMAYLQFLMAQGYYAVRADGADEAIAVIEGYLGVKDVRSSSN